MEPQALLRRRRTEQGAPACSDAFAELAKAARSQDAKDHLRFLLGCIEENCGSAKPSAAMAFIQRLAVATEEEVPSAEIARSLVDAALALSRIAEPCQAVHSLCRLCHNIAKHEGLCLALLSPAGTELLSSLCPSVVAAFESGNSVPDYFAALNEMTLAAMAADPLCGRAAVAQALDTAEGPLSLLLPLIPRIVHSSAVPLCQITVKDPLASKILKDFWILLQTLGSLDKFLMLCLTLEREEETTKGLYEASKAVLAAHEATRDEDDVALVNSVLGSVAYFAAWSPGYGALMRAEDSSGLAALVIRRLTRSPSAAALQRCVNATAAAFSASHLQNFLALEGELPAVAAATAAIYAAYERCSALLCDHVERNDQRSDIAGVPEEAMEAHAEMSQLAVLIGLLCNGDREVYSRKVAPHIQTGPLLDAMELQITFQQQAGLLTRAEYGINRRAICSLKNAAAQAEPRSAPPKSIQREGTKRRAESAPSSPVEGESPTNLLRRRRQLPVEFKRQRVFKEG